MGSQTDMLPISEVPPDRFEAVLEVEHLPRSYFVELTFASLFAIALLSLATVIVSNIPDKNFVEGGIALAAIFLGSEYFSNRRDRQYLNQNAAILKASKEGLWFDQLSLFVPYERLQAIRIDSIGLGLPGYHVFAVVVLDNEGRPMKITISSSITPERGNVAQSLYRLAEEHNVKIGKPSPLLVGVAKPQMG